MNNSYSKIVGYSPLELVDQIKLLQLIKINKIIIEKYYSIKEKDLILVAGTGFGLEASIIKKEFNLTTFGVDLNIKIIPNNQLLECHNLLLQRQDLMSLAFNGNTFSLVYCYHVLEHVPNHIDVLKEIYRVLKPGGILFIGFPNKNRFISYIGTSQKTSYFEKIKWNINDYLYKLKGKFNNKDGAHAGFTEKEFLNDASNIFDTIYSVRNNYMLLKYPKFQFVLYIVNKLKLGEIIFPSNYFICKKKEIIL